MGDRRRVGVATALVLLAGLVAGCQSDGSEGKAASAVRGDSVAGATGSGDVVERPPVPVRRVVRTVPTEPESTTVEAGFPHEEHRGIDCQRCHRRPATHVTHQEADCTACHARIGGPDVSGVDPASRRCATCHHARAARAPCTTCHDVTAVGVRRVAARASVAETRAPTPADTRSLPFDHGRHGAVACSRCHTEPLTRARAVDCDACHDSHHRPVSECVTCHDAQRVAAHDNRVHGGCGGSGCHSDAAVQALPLSRNVCLVCHPGKAEHRPNEDCSECHIAPRRNVAGTDEVSR